MFYSQLLDCEILSSFKPSSKFTYFIILKFIKI